MGTGRLFFLTATAVLALVHPASGQDAAQPDPVDRELADLYAVVVGTQATMRCAVYDDTVHYLAPIEAVALEYRLRRMEAGLADDVDNIGDVVANMRAQAVQIPCGSSELDSYLSFNRTLAHDLIDIALLAWRDIEIDSCSYFADDGFMASARRAHDVGADIEISGAPARVKYIERMAANWVDRFETNCTNLSFDPTRTLPGLVALALPVEP